MILSPLTVLLAASLLGAPADDPAPADRPAPPTARLVDFDALQKRLDEPGLRLLDARTRTEYDKGHLPGAVWVDVKVAEALAARPGGLTDRAAWDAWLKPMGLEPGMSVLVYDSNRQLVAARVWWLLTYLGLPDVGLVNGNFPLWAEQDRPVTAEPTKVAPGSVAVRFRDDRHADRAAVLATLKAGDAQILDARSADEHAGSAKMSKRGGHIPTACHAEWKDFVDAQGRFLDPGKLQARLDAAGLKPGGAVITHCQGGGRASVDAFVLERLGHPTRNYYLGWSDWGNADATPVAEGVETNK